MGVSASLGLVPAGTVATTRGHGGPVRSAAHIGRGDEGRSYSSICIGAWRPAPCRPVIGEVPVSRFRTILAASAVGTLVLALTATPAQAAGATSKVSQTTTVGIHNTYDPATFSYLAQALDLHPGLIELDVWARRASPGSGRSATRNPLGNANNCVAATTRGAALLGRYQQEPGVLPGRHPAVAGRAPGHRAADPQAGAEDRLQQPDQPGPGPTRRGHRRAPRQRPCSSRPTCSAGTPRWTRRPGRTPGRPGRAGRQGDHGGHPGHRRGVQPDRLALDRQGVRPATSKAWPPPVPSASAQIFPAVHNAADRRPAHPLRRHHPAPVVRGLRRRRQPRTSPAASTPPGTTPTTTCW